MTVTTYSLSRRRRIHAFLLADKLKDAVYARRRVGIPHGKVGSIRVHLAIDAFRAKHGLACGVEAVPHAALDHRRREHRRPTEVGVLSCKVAVHHGDILLRNRRRRVRQERGGGEEQEEEEGSRGHVVRFQFTVLRPSENVRCVFERRRVAVAVSSGAHSEEAC